MSNIQFDSDGDVVLVVSSGATKRTVRFQVNSHSLCLASSVFRAMLGANAHFKEGNALRGRSATSPPIEITLGDDEPKALALILRVVHYQYDWVPRTLNDDQLYQVAIVCDKYDMRQVLGLWLDQWIPVDTQVGGKISGDEWLFIAYAFGRQALFTQLSKELILTSTVGAGGSLCPHSILISTATAVSIFRCRTCFNHYIPSSILGAWGVRFDVRCTLTDLAEITTRRQRAIKGMLGVIHQQIETYRDPTVSRCLHQTKSDLCDSFFLGFLQKTFAKLKVYPLKISEPDNHQTTISIQEIKRILDGLKSPDTLIVQAIRSRVCSCASPSTNKSGNCGYCGYPSANHATTCSPIPELKGQIEARFSRVQGLLWSQFVRNAKATTAPKGKALWDYLDSNQVGDF